jgi:hypothetical protein
MRWTCGRLAAAALAACLGCQGESLGGHSPAGAGPCERLFGSSCETSSSSTGGAVGSGGAATGGAVGAGGRPGTGGAAGRPATGGAGGASGAGGGSGGAGVAQFCGHATTTIGSSVRPDVLVVFDRSSSMNDDPNEVSCPGWCGPSSKFEVMGAALDQLVNTNRSVNWGIAYHPTDAGCGVGAGAAVDVAPYDGLAIEASLGSASQLPAGQAPTGPAIAAAAAYLQSRTDGNPKYILLATDGISGCPSTEWQAPAAEATAAIAAALAAGIPTFVVGMAPASDTATTATLAQMSAAGGVPAQNATGFYTTADFGPPFQFPPVPAPQTGTGSCQLDLPYPATAAQLAVDLVPNGQPVAIVQDPINGWSFAAPTSIVFNGTSCTAVMADPGGQIQLAYACGAPPGHRAVEGE